MGNVINLVPDSYYQRLRQFEEDRQLGTFLSALDVIATVTTVDEAALTTWEGLADSVISDEPLTEVLNWVATHRFSLLAMPPRFEEDPSETLPEEKRARLEELGKMAAEASLALESELESLHVQNPVYGRFPGVLPFLRRPDAPWFPAISEPAKVIGAFIDSLYPEDAVSPERAVAAEQPWLGAHVAETLLPWAIARERVGNSRYSAAALSRIETFVPLIPSLFDIHFDFFDPETWGGRFEPEIVAGTLIHLPQAMFDRVLEVTSCDPLRGDLEFPLDPDQPGEEERAARAIIETFELVSVLPVSDGETLTWESIPASVEHHFDALARIDLAPRMSWGHHRFWAFNAMLSSGLDEYVVPDLVAYVRHLPSGALFDEEDLARSLRRIARKLGRLDPYRSVARVGYGDCGYVGLALSNAMENVDVDFSGASFILLLGQDKTFGFADESSIGSPELSEWVPEYRRLAVKRSSTFRLAIDSAFDEGFVSLSCALTAFYLPTQVLAYEGNAAFDWSWLAEALDRAQHWDHEGHVQASVEATVDILDGLADGAESRSVHRMNLSRFLSGARNRISIDKDELKRSLLELREDEDARATRFLEEYVGPANVRWMDRKDVTELHGLVKETVRARDEGHLVAGSPVPGMLLTQWFKFLESRFVRVYDSVVTAELGRDPGRAFGVSGSVAERLSVLEGKGRLKAQVLEQIRDGLPPGLRDDDLLDFLQRFRKVRNKAAHEEMLLPGTFEEIYRELEDGRLREFIEGVLL
ncbi:hypothetical protein TVD_06105 [Thioalkalivibrio versutus]|uniref:Uncharacterized protein n=1 Tax=Thioalkalivibrio versutus TaxID=106634 RepID=A0A0G3G612_9GAMM|nr:hypothetical protein [Thioalkalivibrio versutus]AKJ94957.1 hypothetical protein TVD_06105 [Thioalkalivibrio versutus]